MTPSQASTLKALALADQTATDLITIGNDVALAEWFNTPTTTYVWRTSVPTDEVFDAIIWANLTPVDPPAGTPEGGDLPPAGVSDGAQLYANRLGICIAKQNNLQILLQGKERVASSKATIRAGLSDALLNVPSAAGGATQSAGWAAVKSVLSRFATRAEAALATGAGTQASPSLLSFDGMVSTYDTTTIKNAA